MEELGLSFAEPAVCTKLTAPIVGPAQNIRQKSAARAESVRMAVRSLAPVSIIRLILTRVAIGLGISQPFYKDFVFIC